MQSASRGLFPVRCHKSRGGAGAGLARRGAGGEARRRRHGAARQRNGTGGRVLKLLHVSITARDADTLAAFYRQAFGLRDRGAPRRLQGAAVARGNGLPGSDIRVIRLDLPGSDGRAAEGRQNGPFLELMQYAVQPDRPPPPVNAPGLGHLAFEVADLPAAVAAVLEAGGRLQGEITRFGQGARACLIVYLRDPEGNILELEQRGIGEAAAP